LRLLGMQLVLRHRSGGSANPCFDEPPADMAMPGLSPREPVG